MLWRVGSRLDLERAHNPLYWGFDANPRAQQIAELPIPLGFEPKGALITETPPKQRCALVDAVTMLGLPSTRPDPPAPLEAL